MYASAYIKLLNTFTKGLNNLGLKIAFKPGENIFMFL